MYSAGGGGSHADGRGGRGAGGGASGREAAEQPKGGGPADRVGLIYGSIYKNMPPQKSIWSSSSADSEQPWLDGIRASGSGSWCV